MGRTLDVERWVAYSGGVCELRYHFVWCPKYRRPVLTGPIADRLEALLLASVDEMRGRVLELAIQPDHVHLFVQLMTPERSIAQIAHRLKGSTSRTLRHEFPTLRSRLPTLWSKSYFVATTGAVSKDTIARYIANQKGR